MSDVTASLFQVFQAFGRLLDALADDLLLSDDAEHRRLFVLHEQVGQGPSVLVEILDHDLRPRVGELATQLIARYCGIDPGDEVLRMRIMMLFGQVLVFSAGRQSMAPKLGWEQMGSAKVAMIKKAALEHCRVLMEHWRVDAQVASLARKNAASASIAVAPAVAEGAGPKASAPARKAGGRHLWPQVGRRQAHGVRHQPSQHSAGRP